MRSTGRLVLGICLGLLACFGENYVVSEGSIKGLQIGATREEIARTFLASGTTIVALEPDPAIKLYAGDDLAPLRNAERIVLGVGDVAFDFEGDEVSSVWVAPVLEKHRSQFPPVRNRDEVLAALPRIAALVGVRMIRNDTAIRSLSLSEALADPDGLLRRYDRWRVQLRDNDGYWTLHLQFGAGVLTSVTVQHRTSEFL